MNIQNPRHPGRAALQLLRFVLIATLFFMLSAVGLANQVSAGLIIISAPPSVLPGAIQSQVDATIFYESTTTLAAPLPVDIIAPGTYNLNDPDNPGSIPARTTVNSYLLHHESVANQLSTVIVAGTFPQPILGVIIGDAKLDNSDPILGNPNTQYPTGLAYRGLELPYEALADVVFWSGNQVFISVKSTTADVLDQVRIITAVPEPSTICLTVVAAPALLLAWRKRRAKK